eukprot:2611648-Prymnesium_polylepis.1
MRRREHRIVGGRMHQHRLHLLPDGRDGALALGAEEEEHEVRQQLEREAVVKVEARAAREQQRRARAALGSERTARTQHL